MMQRKVIVLSVQWTLAPTDRWWWRLVHSLAHRQHLLCIVEEPPGSGVWTLLNWTQRGLDILTVFEVDLERLIATFDVLERITVWTERVNREAPWGWFQPPTCVSLVKRVVGVRDWRVQTPISLIRTLRSGEVTTT